MTAVIATWIMKTEDGTKGDCMLESTRLRIVSNEFDPTKRQTNSQCTKKVPRVRQGILLPKAKLQW